MNNSYAGKIIIYSAVLVLCASCQSAVMEDTAAAVNGQPILLSEYQKNRNSVMEQYKKGMPEFFQQKDAEQQLEQKILNQMIDDAILYQQAEKLKIKLRERELENGMKEVKSRFRMDDYGKVLSDEEAEAVFRRELKKEAITPEQFKERIRKQLMIRKVIDEVLKPRVKAPEEKEVKAYFEKVKSAVTAGTTAVAGMNQEESHEMLTLAQKFRDMTAERVRVRHILVKTDEKTSIVDKSRLLKKAQDIKKQIDEGMDFDELAKSSEDTESAPRGGDIGFIIKGWMDPAFEKAAFSTNVGDVSGPVETKFGFHIIKIEEKRAPQKLNYDEVREDLAQYLAGAQMQKELLSYIKELRAKASIQINIKK